MEGPINPMAHLGQIHQADGRYSAWETILEHLVEIREIPRARQLIRTFPMEFPFLKNSHNEMREISGLLARILKDHNLPEDECEEEMAQLAKLLVTSPEFGRKALEGTGVPINLPEGRAYLLPGDTLRLIPLERLGIPFERWQIRTQLLSDGRVALQRQILGDSDHSLPQGPFWAVHPILITAD